MAGRSDGSAIKALFPPSKGDPPTSSKKKKTKSPSGKNDPPPEENSVPVSPPKNTPPSEKEGKSLSPHKDTSDQCEKKSSPMKEGSPPKGDKNVQKEGGENIWKAPPKIHV